MKVLMITPYVTISSRPELSKNKTGFGYMVYDIARAVGKVANVQVLCSDSRGVGFKADGVDYLRRSFPLFIKHIAQSLSFGVVLKFSKGYKLQKGTMLRLCYYWLMTGYLAYLINKGKFDIVHIHGCGFSTDLWVRVCEKYNQKCLVTLHGLNSFSETVKLEPAGKKQERDFLNRVVNGEIHITVISSGMKRLIENAFNVKACSNITVVCNAFSFKDRNGGKRKDIRDVYNIPMDAKIILYVGNISENKNQIQMVEAFSLLPIELQKTMFVLFCGRPDDTIKLDRIIEKQQYSEHLIICGAIDKDKICDYYYQSDATALLSYAEGFGLSLIEGMHFGLPCMMFSDMDAYEDIYNECSTIGIPIRNNISVAKALEVLVTTQWNKAAIVSYSQKFKDSKMASNYLDVYQRIINRS
jgi:glycosyltransferase involved in cell wall biosynthesis